MSFYCHAWKACDLKNWTKLKHEVNKKKTGIRSLVELICVELIIGEFIDSDCRYCLGL